MKLSELIRKGAPSIEVPSYWNFLVVNRDGKIEGCVMGAAFIGATGKLLPDSPPGNTCGEIQDAITDALGFNPETVQVNHPTGDYEVDLWNFTQIYFDDLGKDFEKTAAWLESIGY